MTPDRVAIAAFLSQVVRTDIHIVALLDDIKETHGRYFGSNVAAATEWAAQASEVGWNVYWTVNMVDPGLNKKPSKSDMRAARFVHVDIDPPAGQPVAEWDRQGAYDRLVASAPTVIIDSGGDGRGGWQGLWRLSEPTGARDLIEGINRGAIAALNGDPACANIDRLLRLPGAINRPKQKKRDLGRVDGIARLVRPDNGTVFTPAGLFAPIIVAPVDRILPEIGEWEEQTPESLIPPADEALTKRIAQPDGADRSKDVAACALEMASRGYSAAMIFGVLMNPTNAVHAHIADQGDPVRAAMRAVAQAMPAAPARGFAETPVLPVGVSQTPPAGYDKRRSAHDEHMGLDAQIRHFDGCTWVGDQNRVWTGRDMLDKARFDVVYGGHMFMMDPFEYKKSASAWETFTTSRALTFPRADGLAFRPLLPSGAVVSEEGRTLLNIWVPIETKRVAGDPSRFIDFLARLLPDAGDRAIILAYMASLVQNPGRKFQWWPVVQGTEGNGKSLLLRCLTHAVGSRYTHLPNAPELARNGLKFNGWVTGNLLCGIEEISVGHKRDFLEEFKPIVTNDRVPIERKGVDQVTGDNCLNGMLFTNHRDGVPVTVDTRRYAIFYTAQQCKEDKVRDGMTGGYFPDLYEWLRGEGRYAGLGENYGYAVVAGYLAAYDVPTALDPAGLCVEAPPTSSTASAIVASYGRVEQEIVEAIEQGRTGFAGGWISSIWLDRLLADMRVTVARNKRRDMLRGLGYIPHPALTDGRTTGVVKPDDGKPRLYVRHGHPWALITDAADVAKTYSAAQDGVVARTFQVVT